MTAHKPFLCRIGIHTSTFADTTGANVGSEASPVYMLATVYRCNWCGAEVAS